jgi:hypothetical protein
MSMSMAGIGVHGSLWIVMAAGLAGAGAFALIPIFLKSTMKLRSAFHGSG